MQRRWRAWLGLAALVALLAGSVTAAVSGARRTETAYARLVAADHGAQYMVDDFIPNPEAATVDPAAVAGLPAIAEADSFRVYGTVNEPFNVVASPDGRAYGTGLNRLKVLDGRLPAPNRVDEAAVDFSLAGARVGQRVTVALQPSQGGDAHRPAAHAAPLNVSFLVVGIVAAPSQFPPFPSNGYFTGSNYYLTPAFYRAHAHSVTALEYSLVRVRPGESGAAARQLERLGHGRPVGALDLRAQGQDVVRSTHLVAVALWLLAGLLLVVSLLVLAQLLSRQAMVESSDNFTLLALGMSRRQLALVAVVRTALIGASGAAAGLVLAAAFSPLTPIGLAGTAEPNPGVHLDVAVFAAALVGTIVLVTALAVWPALREANSASGRRADHQMPRSHRLAIPNATVRAGLPVTVATGLRLALDRGRGPSAIPVWSTIGGAAVGMAALVASLSFGASLGHLLETPHLYGVTWDTEIWNTNGPASIPRAVPVLRSDPDVATAAYIQTGLDVRLDGRALSGFAFAPIKGTLASAVLSGRSPGAADEIALGADTASGLGSGIGSILRGSAENESAPAIPVRVVGTVVIPPGDVSAHLGDGVLLTRQGLVRLAGGPVRSPYVIAVGFRPGTDPGAARTRLDRRLAAVDANFFTQPPATPTDLVNFGRIQNLPFLLGSLLAAVAVMTLAHLLFTSVTRRRHDLAVLKTLGFVRSDVRKTLAWQATALSVVALVLAVPLGLAGGRLAWRVFAATAGVVPEPVTPALAVVVVIPATIVVANLLVAWPAWRVNRTSPASVLQED